MSDLIFILLLVAFTLAFYVIAGMLQERYEKLMQSRFVPVEKHHRRGLFMRSADSRKLFCVVLGIFGGVLGLSLKIGVLGVALGALLGGGVPYFLMGARERKRRLKIEGQIVPMLNMLANSMKAGKTLPQAIEDASQNAPKPISQELAILARQVMVGVQLNHALRDFQNRIGMPDVKLAVRSMIVSIHTGADLPSAMKQIANTITERNKVNGKIRTLTTQGKMQGMIMGAAPFVLLGAFYYMDPDYERVMFQTWQGNVVLGIIIGLQVIAFFMIQNIIKVKV